MRGVWQERVREVPAASKTFEEAWYCTNKQKLGRGGKVEGGWRVVERKSWEDETARQEENLGLALEIWGKSRLEAPTV
jgi:hypothetical protein